MNQKIMSYVPKSKVAAIRDAYKDEDGYWICLNEGWEASRTDSGCRTIHEDTIKELRYQIAGIQRVVSKEPDPELKEIQDSMTEAFYEFCTGEPAPDNWKEIVEEERSRKVPAEAVEIILEDIMEDPEYHDTTIPPRSNPDPELPASTGKTGMGAAESVAFGLCLGLAYAMYGAREMIELMILTIQVLWIRAVPLARRAGKALYVAWLEFYPVARQTAWRTVRIAAKQAAMAVWRLWVVIA